MDKEMFFIIYLEEYTFDGMTESGIWKIGSSLLENYDDTMNVYKQVSQSHSCRICKTIFG